MVTPGVGKGGWAPKMSLNSIVNHTGHELGGELCEIFKFWSFLWSKSAYNVCKLLQFLGVSSPRLHLPLDPAAGFPSPRALGYEVKGKEEYLYSAILADTTPTKRSDMDHAVLPANYTMSAFPS